MSADDELTALNVISFPVPANMPLQVGEDKGFFAAEGLRVTNKLTPSSSYLMKNLIDGEFDIAAGAIDNPIAYMEGQGAVETENEADLVVFMGGADYTFPLLVAPDVQSWADLKGRKLAVDALNTGYAFLMRKMIGDNGLADDDYEFVAVGGPTERAEAMKSGEYAGALVTDAAVRMMQPDGFKVLTSDPDPWAGYQGNVLFSRRAWIADNRDALLGFIRGFQKAVDWTLDGANADALPAILVRYLPHIPPPAAGRAAAALQADGSPLKPGTPINIDGVRTVLDLRSRYGAAGGTLGEPQKYIDLSYFETAMGSTA
jgi:ABC-type nitrate/sulfonate/bicarbonate transport system substrate-binding protein